MSAIIDFKNGSGKQGKEIYLVSAPSDFGGYDTFDSFVCCADSEEEARKMHPDGILDENDVGINFSEFRKHPRKYTDWINFSDIHMLKVELLGDAKSQEKGVILASFNAG